jgi:rhodanese-related sulfurtransferase
MSTATEVSTPAFVKKAKSRVLESPAASPVEAVAHFEDKLRFETDCSDVYAAQVSGTVDFILLDVRNRQAFTKGHVPDAIHIPVPAITEERLSLFPEQATFVVYCAGPHCNGANKAALRIAKLGRPVKEMIGGVLGWVDEGFSLVTG